MDYKRQCNNKILNVKVSVIQPRVLLYEYFPSKLTYHVLLLRYKLQVSWLFIFLICVSLSVLPSNASFPSYPQLWFDYVLQPHLPLCLHPLEIMQKYSLHAPPYLFVSVTNCCRYTRWTHEPCCPEKQSGYLHYFSSLLIPVSK